jgi:hypothetical protein
MLAIIIEALMGLFGSAILCLAGFQTILGRRFNNNLRWNLLALSIARRDTRILAMAMSELPLPRAAVAEVDVMEKPLQWILANSMRDIPPPRAVVEKPLQSCPSCGLQGPEQLIKEHLLGSPTHLAGKPQVDSEEDVPFEAPRKREDPASVAMLRSILRQLAPPRAFGLRSREREIDPLRGLALRSKILPSRLVSTASQP